MKVAITGVTGLIGSALRDSLEADGHEVVAISRRNAVEGLETVTWDVSAGRFDARALEGTEALVHLAGEPIAQRWTAAVKEAIRFSRVAGTKLLVQGISRLEQRPRLLLSASAVGYYGDRGDAELDESAPPGEGFLPEICQEWERAAAEVEALGVRRVSVRNGIVLSAGGGALRKMLLPFRLGLGGRVGDGRQWMSWIHIDDIVALYRRVLDDATVRGPVNGTAPAPVRNADFTEHLGRALHRPTVLPVPAFALRLIFGEMSSVLLESQRALPQRAQEIGFEFRHARLAGALSAITERL